MQSGCPFLRRKWLFFISQDDQDWGGVLWQQVGGAAGLSQTAESQLLQEPPQVGDPFLCLFSAQSQLVHEVMAICV